MKPLNESLITKRCLFLMSIFSVQIATAQLANAINSPVKRSIVTIDSKANFLQNIKQISISKNESLLSVNDSKENLNKENDELKKQIDVIKKAPAKPEKKKEQEDFSNQIYLEKQLKRRIDANSNFKQVTNQLNYKDSIIFINSANIENTFLLVDSFSSKDLAVKQEMMNEFIQIKYLSKKRNDALREYKQEYYDAQLQLDKLNKVDSILKNKDKFIEVFSNFNHEKARLYSLEKILVDANDIVDKGAKAFSDKYIKNKNANADAANKPALDFNSNFLNSLVVTPSLSLLGKNQSENGKVYRETGVSIGLVSDKQAQNNLSFFYSDLSTFKIFARYTASYKRFDNMSSGAIAFNAEASFVGKKYFTDTSKTKESYNATMFFSRVGLEGFVIDKILTAYFNVKAFAPVSGFDKFREYKSTNKSIYGAVDFGFNFLFTPITKRADGLNIVLNLNFLTTGGDVETFTKYDGFLVPSVRLGVSQNLNIFGKNKINSD